MRAVSLSNRGGRKNNEDCVGYARAGEIWCFVLCDGLGGQLCGEVASRLVCDTVCDEFEKNPEISRLALCGYLEKAVEAIGEARDEDKYNMSSTAVALVTNGKQAVWAHMGDSRLYYISGGGILSITDDHSVAFMEFERGMITYDDIRRSPSQNKLLRCISDMDNFMPDISDITELTCGDAFLLCSDGFWEYVTEDDIEKAINQSSSPKEWLEKMLDVLHENEIEKNDNYSAIAVMV
ncbi:MAG: PP2C family protein-serine/threonine phosphatase [Hominilimicola sp.]